MDYVSVRGLSVPAVIGVRDWERDITQTLVFNVDMVPSARDVRRAAETDDLAEALDYSEVAQTISSISMFRVSGRPCPPQRGSATSDGQPAARYCW